ncbi:putative polysaccharide biosynthesis protein [Metabacillus indicus]|uniref:Uncharacterized protein n=1 Tax=Metabacillus indicus TaxID=246786 RepID=A0A084GQT3_METID|nr:polysaccharide biosynthesis protein [Metabacillus indicus]KEZ49695.1 hypothetical protein GS18_0214795 [Metabacillus indicus]
MDVRSGPSKHLFLQGTAVLTIAALLIKIMSAAYRVPYQNIVGDIGFYIYQQVYPFYGIAIMLATTGFPVIISKMMIEFVEKGNASSNSKILRVSFLFLFAVGLIFYLILYIGSDQLASFMGDPELAPLIRVISFSFLLVPFVSILRGYFQGEENMLPTAVSQVAEQGIRVLTILIFSYLLINNGYSLYEAGQGALFGSLTGGFAAFILLAVFLSKDKRGVSFFGKNDSSIRTSHILSYLVKHSLTISITSLMIIFIQLIDAMQLYSELLKNGFEMSDAKRMKGIYDRGQPLIQLGTVVATSFSLSLVPLIAYAKRSGNHAVISERITASLKICTVVGAGASAGLIMIMEPLNIMLFKNESGTEVLAVLSLSVIFTSYSLTLAAILQGLNYTVFPAFAVLIGTAAKLALNELLVPEFGTAGAAFATVAAYGVIAGLNTGYLKSKGYGLAGRVNTGKVAAAALIMMGALFAYSALFSESWMAGNRLAASAGALCGALFGGTIYLIAILKLSIFTQKELEAFPGGKKLGAFLK